MTTLDYIVLAPMAWGLISGWRKGFLVEIATLLALLIGITGAFKLTNTAATFMATNLGIHSKFLPMIAFLTVFVLLVVGIHFFTKSIEKLLKAVHLGFVNNLAGAAFGLLKAAFLSSIIVWLFNKVGVISPETAQKSISFEFLITLAPTLLHYAGFLLPYAKDLFGQMGHFFDNVATNNPLN